MIFALIISLAASVRTERLLNLPSRFRRVPRVHPVHEVNSIVPAQLPEVLLNQEADSTSTRRNSMSDYKRSWSTFRSMFSEGSLNTDLMSGDKVLDYSDVMSEIREDLFNGNSRIRALPVPVRRANKRTNAISNRDFERTFAFGHAAFTMVTPNENIRDA